MKKQAKAAPSSSPVPRVRRRKPKPSDETLVWEGITLAIAYQRHWLPPDEDYPGRAHLEVRVIAPEGAPLPITDTGYRSHFLLTGIAEQAGGPAAYVRRWLDEASRQPHWRRIHDRWRQLSLF